MGFSNALRQKIYNRDKYVCQYCGLDGLISFENHWLMEVDHIVPKSRGGTDHENNAVVACRICNSIKNPHHANYPKEIPVDPAQVLEFFKNHCRAEIANGKKLFEDRKKSLTRPST